MDVETQTLTSPYYPQNYFPEDYFADEHGCEWLITAPEGNIISLEFDHFNVSNIKMQKTIFISAIILYFSYMMTMATLLHCLMEFVIKLKNYKNYLDQCQMMSNGSFTALDSICWSDLMLDLIPHLIQ